MNEVSTEFFFCRGINKKISYAKYFLIHKKNLININFSYKDKSFKCDYALFLKSCLFDNMPLR